MWFSLVLSVLFGLIVASSVHSHHDQDIALAQKAMVCDGKGYFSLDNMNDRGTNMIDVQPNVELMKSFWSLKPKQFRDINTDGETYDILTEFFWGKANGISIELGALDGKYLSQTKLLSDTYGWHRILIEANPKQAEGLPVNSPEALAYNAAVCSKSQIVHYVNNGPTSGIYEFLPSKLKSYFHKGLYNESTHQELDLDKLEHVIKVPCVPMRSILQHANTSYVNAMILDTEGAELDILKSISWSDIIIEVLVVETDRPYRSPGYEMRVRTFLLDKGYNLYMRKGRNSWFIHRTFVPSKKPN